MPWRPTSLGEGHVSYRWRPLTPDQKRWTDESAVLRAALARVKVLQLHGNPIPPDLEVFVEQAARAVAYAGRANPRDYTHEAGRLNDCRRLRRVVNPATMIAQSHAVHCYPGMRSRDVGDDRLTELSYGRRRRPHRQ